MNIEDAHMIIPLTLVAPQVLANHQHRHVLLHSRDKYDPPTIINRSVDDLPLIAAATIQRPRLKTPSAF